MIYDEDKGSKVNGSTSLFYFYWIAAKVMFSAKIQEASFFFFVYNNFAYMHGHNNIAKANTSMCPTQKNI